MLTVKSSAKLRWTFSVVDRDNFIEHKRKQVTGYDLIYGKRRRHHTILYNSLVSTISNIRIIRLTFQFWSFQCALTSLLQNTHQDSLLQNVTLAILVVHCYGHEESCQVLTNICQCYQQY